MVQRIKTGMIADGAITAIKLTDEVENLFSLRNRLINGGFEFWQRGTSRTVLSGGTPYLADRWTGAQGFQNGAHARVNISSPPEGLTSQYALRSSTSTSGEVSGGTRMTCNQKIENLNCYDLSGQTITVSGWIRFSNTTFTTSFGSPGALAIRVQINTSTTDSATTTDTGDLNMTVSSISGSGLSNNITNAGYSAGSFPTTWTRFSFTGTLPSGVRNISLRIEHSNLINTSVAGSEWYEIAELQLEKSPVATPFERRPIGMELALCQRYYQSHGNMFQCGFAYGSGTDGFTSNYSFPVTMRVAPTSTVTSGNDGQSSAQLVVSNISTYKCTFEVRAAGGGDNIVWYFWNQAFGAEL